MCVCGKKPQIDQKAVYFIVELAGFTLALEFQVTFIFKALPVDTSIVTVTA
jgi:hypothetical protein